MGLFKKDKSTIINGAVELVTGIRKMVDDKQFTAEERARYNAKIADASAQFAKDMLSENTERSKARRSIAIVSIYFFYFLVIALIVLWKFDPLWFEAAKTIIIEFQLPFAFIAIIGFFFGAHLMRASKVTK